MIIPLLIALHVRLLVAENFGDEGMCPSDPWNEKPVEGRDCYFLTNDKTADIAKLFCESRGMRNAAIPLVYQFDQATKYCPPGSHRDCDHCADWRWGIGCAKMRGEGFKYSKFLKGVEIDFMTLWDSGDEVYPNGIRSEDWEPVRMWVGCEKVGDEINAIEISIQAPSTTAYLEHKMLPWDMFKKFHAAGNYLEKLTIQAQLWELRWDEIPGGLDLEELDISHNAFWRKGWPNLMFERNSKWWEDLKKLSLSHNKLGQYPSFYYDEPKGRAPWHSLGELTHLDISNNKIPIITPCTFGCGIDMNDKKDYNVLTPMLKSVDLSNNELGPDAFTHVLSIDSRSLDWYPKHYVLVPASEVFWHLRKLKSINLANNKLTYLPPLLFTPNIKPRGRNNLEMVDLRGNPLKCLPLAPGGSEWTADGPFFWDGPALGTCKGQPKRSVDVMGGVDMLDGARKYWYVLPLVGFVGLGLALALKAPKGEEYQTMA